MLKQKPAPVVRRSVGKSGGRYIENSESEPELRPIAASHQNDDTWSRTTPYVAAIAAE